VSEVLLRSLALAAASAGLLLLLGPVLAYLNRRPYPGRSLIEALLLTPLALPPTVLGFYLLLLFAPDGPLARIGAPSLAFTFPGMVVGAALFSLPFAYTAYREAFRALDEDLLETARTLGAGWLRRAREVVLPLVWPGLVSGTLLAFAHALGEFGVVLMVGGNIPGKTQVASTYIYDLVEGLEFAAAHRASLVMLALAFALVYLTRQLEERWRSATGSRGRSRSR